MSFIRTENVTLRLLIIVLVMLLVITGFSLSPAKAHATIPVDSKVIVGYWHNFDNGSGFIRLRDVSPDFDVINVSFAEPTNGPQGGTIGFTPFNATEEQFKSDVQYLQSQGKKVIISIGGANGQVQLVNANVRNQFISSMKTIITKYGFDGLDIDFEGHSLYFNSGDSDFRNPTTPVITNLISAVRELHDFYGTNFMLTMAPETFFVQVGYKFYGGSCLSCDNRAGSYLPVIHVLRDIIDWVQVQHYNSGQISALDNQFYAMGNADFHVAMADMVLTGFPVAGNSNHFFTGLRPDQVVIGLPANVNAGGGFTTVAEVHKALNYLYKGESFGGSYVLRNGAHPGMRGLMTWSINWDKYNNFQFSTSHRAYLNQLNTGGGDVIAPTIPGSLQVVSVIDRSVNLSWIPSTDNRGVTGYIISYGTMTTSVNGATTNATISGLNPGTTYTFTVKARDAAGNQSAASNAVTATISYPLEPPIPSGLYATNVTSSSLHLGWLADTEGRDVAGYSVSYGNTVINSSTKSVQINALTPNTTYTFVVKTYDSFGNVSRSSLPLSVTTNPASVCTVQEWDANTVYTGGQRASYNGNIYEARWWTKGERPDISSVWKLIGPCGPADLISPTTPTNLQSISMSATSIVLGWSASTDNVGVTGYTVYYGSSSVNVAGNTTTATITGLTYNTIYTFTVKARDAAGNLSLASNPYTRLTPSSPDTTAPTVPTNVQASGITNSSVTLSWAPSTDEYGVTGYTVSYGSTSINVMGTTTTINNLTAGTSYTFIVKALDAAGNVSIGSTVQATTSTTNGPAAWAPNVSYKVGDQVTFGGRTYSCRQPHTSLLGWEPTNVPALWSLV
ncbi:fibronectin type III domain-containing protein [Paenibacillus sp. GSMTC-2017]|uniref:fibronectin type III domain-containing protein n=1 Tax=Paenibacillus sp. GSMTC-2017 TaxID=2794350 RepID=UPI0018D9DC0F|nr:fibronectin type III domain-containing protein [Paenibacillus sp. GSMTC-2017]MBH5316948.1 fibronectin type III domain-containing protein [Paenibacillus sp. GSMTC-2017]